MEIEIKNRYTGAVIFSLDEDGLTIKRTVEKAVEARISLGGAYLRGADLGDAYLGGAYLRGADLGGAYLGGADLRGADLGDADLGDAYLGDADLGDAYLRGADLGGAYLRGADLGGADLRGADLGDADLGDAYLGGAYLGDAYLRGADLGGAYLGDAKGIFYPLSCPSDGDFVGWKKITTQDFDAYLVKMRIPADAKRSSATTHKCRCEFAEVLAIEPIGNAPQVQTICHNAYGHTTTYAVGQIVRPDKWDENRWNECSNGIHFFCDREAALNW